MKSIFNKNVLIAVTVIISLCLLYWGIEYLKGINLFKPANFYYANFEQVEGLNISAPVRINGFQVGLVREINYDYDNNQISVLMSLNKNLKIPHGSTVSLDKEVLGTATLSINLGHEKENYEVGDRIESVIPGGLMDKVDEDIMPQVARILPKLDSILYNVNALVSNPALHSSVTRLDAITADLANSSQQLTGLMAQLNGKMPQIVSNVDGVTTNLNTTTQNINQLSESLANAPIEATLSDLNATVANLRQVTNQLNDKNSSLGLLLNDKSLYENANSSIMSLDELLKDIKCNPKRYINIKVF
mgnify:CR=1 FL=1